MIVDESRRLHDRRRKQRGVDYMLEIPFEKKPAAGFYDTSDEKLKHKGKDFTNITLQEMEGKRRRDLEDDERKKDAKRLKQMKEAGAVPAMQINKLDLLSLRLFGGRCWRCV